MDANRDAERRTGSGSAGDRIRPIAKILVVDIAAPLVTYSVLRAAGLSTVTSLVLSGVIPAIGVAAGIIRKHRLDVIGALVLAGIVVGTVLGLVTHDPKLVLMEGSVPTAVLGVVCLVSLFTRRPLMFSFALEFTGPDTPNGREMSRLWQYEEFRRIFRVITTVWGVGFLLEAALRVIIVYGTSTGTALASSKVTPLVWAGALSVWTAAYGARQKRKGELLAAAEMSAVSGAQQEPADHED